MTLRVYQNGVEIVSQAFIENLVIEESADRGTIANWSFPVDDPGGTLTLTAHYPISVTESASVYGSQVAYGFLTNRAVTRSDTSLTSNARAWNPQVIDLNAYLGFKAIYSQTFHRKRPSELDIHRVRWLLNSTTAVLPAIHDYGLVATTGGNGMPANDYDLQFPIDVLSDCALASGRTFFIYWDQTHGAPALFYRKPSDAVNTSPISVSNYPGEANQSTVFAPMGDAELILDPAHFYSRVLLRYSGGEVVSTVDGRTIARDVIAPTANTTSRSHAQLRADRLLADYQNEEARLTFTIRVPNTHVNAIVAGQRVAVKFSHLPGYSTSTYVRVVHRTIKPAAGTNNTAYDLTIECVDPIMLAPGAAPGNSTTWPSDGNPFQGGSAGSFTFIQSAKTTNDTTAPPTATFATTPVSGNLLVAIMLATTNGGSGPTDFVATFPTGWTTVVGPVGVSSDNRLQGMWIATKTAGSGEATTVAPDIKCGTSSAQNGYIVLAEYSTGGGAVTVASSNVGALTGPSNTGTLPALTPPVGGAALIVQCVAHEPNYTSTYSAGWNNRNETTVGGPRQALAFVDQIIATASGSSYTGTATVAGLGESNWFVPAVAFISNAATPIEGQPVTDPPTTSPGSGSTRFTTQYPYVPGSLKVTVDGIPVTVIETSPAAGLYDLTFVPNNLEVVNVTYQADPQGGVVKYVDTSTPVSQFRTWVADLSVDFIYFATGTYGAPWDHVTIDVDRTNNPLWIGAAPGATPKFVGTGATTGDGIFSIGRTSSAKYITFDGFTFDGIAIASAGVIGVNGTDNCTFRNMTFKNLTRDPVYANQPYKSWCFYITSEKGRANNNLFIDTIVATTPVVNRDVSFIQVYNGSGVTNTGISITNCAATSYDYAMFIGESVTGLDLDSWEITDCGEAGKSFRISDGTGVVACSGTYSNIHGHSSSPKLFNYTGGGTMTDGGGNTGI